MKNLLAKSVGKFLKESNLKYFLSLKKKKEKPNPRKKTIFFLKTFNAKHEF